MRWRGQDCLLTGSGEDGVVALWDLGVKAPPVMGNEERVTQIVLAGEPQTVVSVDRGGTIVGRRSETGTLTVCPLATGIEHTNAVVAWSDGGQVIAATGAGSRRAPHGYIRRWNIATGSQEEPAIVADRSYVGHLGLSSVAGRRMLMALGPESRLRLWDAADGRLRSEIRTVIDVRPVNGFATAVVQGRPAVVISAYYKETTAYFLDGLSPSAFAVPHVGTDFVVDLVEGRIVMGANDEKRIWRTIRGWDLAGASLGPVVRREAGITAVALSGWPEAFVATLDRMVSLVNLETGLEVCPALRLPRTAHALAVTADGDLIAGFGSDVARFRPPGREPGPAK